MISTIVVAFIIYEYKISNFIKKWGKLVVILHTFHPRKIEVQTLNFIKKFFVPIFHQKSSSSQEHSPKERGSFTFLCRLFLSRIMIIQIPTTYFLLTCSMLQVLLLLLLLLWPRLYLIISLLVLYSPLFSTCTTVVDFHSILGNNLCRRRVFELMALRTSSQQLCQLLNHCASDNDSKHIFCLRTLANV